CAAPFVALSKVILVSTESAPVPGSTFTSVAKGGLSALFTAMRTLSTGSKAASSARRRGAAGRDFADDPIGAQVDGDDAARGVRDEEEVAGDHHSVRSRGVVVAGESLEAALDLPDEDVVPGVDHVDCRVRAIGEEGRLG